MNLPILLHAGCAALYGLLALVVLFSARPDRTSCGLAAAALVTAAWAGGVAMGADRSPHLAGWLDLAQSAAWYGFVIHLYHRAIPNGSRLGRLLSGLGLATIALVAASLVGPVAGPLGAYARLALAVCTILLIENLYRNTVEDLRWHVTLPCVALGGLFVYDIVLYSDAVLFRRLSPVLLDGQAVVIALLAPLLAVSALRNRRRWGVSIQVSHQAVFHSASLIVTGVFLLGLAASGEILRQTGAGRDNDWRMVIEVSLICGGVLAAGVFLTSGSARSGLRQLVVNNFLAHRYDYRVEWQRCIETLAQTNSDLALHTRAIKAVAQTVDSPGGMVFLRERDDGAFDWAGSWNLPAAPAAIAADHPLVRLCQDGRAVVQAPAGTPWVDGLAELWLAVPLYRAGQLMGLTLVSPSRAPFALDPEVFALLHVVGQEVASYIAERRAAEALLQTRQLHEYGQRFAFVAHDIKNVSSQLSLLLANAEHHISNPDFQRDMLGTVGSTVQKITTLLAKLKAPPEAGPLPAITVRERLAAIAAAAGAARRGRIVLACDDDLRASMAAAAFEAVVTHLLDNAFEASDAGACVRIDARRHGNRVLIDIADAGAGMSAEFVRDKLFRPFSSSKTEGFGIGVYQARALLRQAGGDLTVTSAPGRGTTMHLSAPLADLPVAAVSVLQ